MSGSRCTDLDRPPPGWFVLDVMRKVSRKWDWVALMIDVHPEDFAKGEARVANAGFLFRESTGIWT
jgi:hypothetical protein